jgi:hypothetical protein
VQKDQTVDLQDGIVDVGKHRPNLRKAVPTVKWDACQQLTAVSTLNQSSTEFPRMNSPLSPILLRLHVD